jgi:uncharacterized protein (UPF0276 family)
MTLQSGAVGAGFRPAHYREITERRPVGFDFFEVVTENYLGVGGRPQRFLKALREAYPVAMHGVSLDIGSRDPLDARYVEELVQLARWLEPAYVSDHLCWTTRDGRNSHDLLPLAYTTETLGRVAGKLAHLQERLGRRFYLENPSAYVAFAGSTWGEDDFLAELVRRTGCGLLLDVNNLYVNARNLGLDAEAYLTKFDGRDLAYLHLAGHTDAGDVLIDTHDEPVSGAVWGLLRRAASLWPDVAALIEWDDNLPPVADLEAQCAEARTIIREARAVTDPAPRQSVPEVVTRRGGATIVRSLVDEDALHERFFAVVTDPAAAAEAAMQLVRTDLHVTPERGVRVYRDAYLFRLIDVFRGEFPATAKLAGDAFAPLVTAYLEAEPPSHWAIGEACAGFPRFLKDPLLTADVTVPFPLAALGDAATIERVHTAVIVARDVTGTNGAPSRLYSTRVGSPDTCRSTRVSSPAPPLTTGRLESTTSFPSPPA